MKTVGDTVFFDIDTQIDFLYPAGALYVPGAETIVPVIAALNRYAGAHGIPLISTIDAHTENDPEFQSWPPHCVAGTAGQQKPGATLLDKRATVANVADAPLPDAPQIVLEKQTTDCFTNVNLARLLQKLGAVRFVVYGVVTEICVKNAVWGLIRTGAAVELALDATRSLSDEAAAKFLREFTAAGGAVTDAARVMRLAA